LDGMKKDSFLKRLTKLWWLLLGKIEN
jgi:hypothetical protein